MAAICSNADAIENYKCVIGKAYELSDSGDLKVSALAKGYIGAEFVVDKGTGRMIGLISNYNASGKPAVLDPGGNDQAFKVITVYKPKTTVDYLQVHEFRDEPKKPFLFVTNWTVLSGVCIPY